MIGDVIWTTPGQSSADSLPLGNGDLAANVWTESNGDIVFYLAKNDAWDYLGRLIKIGRLRLTLKPGLLASGAKFEQKLSLEDASIIVSNETVAVRIWIDAHWPRLVVEVSSTQPCEVRASLDPWRTGPREIGPKESHSASGMNGGPVPLIALPDIIAHKEPGAVIWHQRNESSIWGLTLDQQGLGDFKATTSDPLLHRTFGGCLTGTGFKKKGNLALVTAKKTNACTLTVTVHTAQTETTAAWLEQIRAAAAATASSAPADLWRDHQQWWQDFWARSYIRPAARAPDWGHAAMVAQQSAWLRYLIACCSRGLFPVKFNGGLFTADWQMKDESFDADYRRWGGGYWWQNTRLPYWATLASGDYELLRPLFRMYYEQLTLAEERTRIWFGHGGAFISETHFFWGTYLPSNYGWDRAGKEVHEVENPYIGRLYIGGLELIALMLETHAHTGDTAMLQNELLPIARAVLKFFALHYPNDRSGKLRIAPAQCMETWWEAENPLPEIAGLHYLLPRLLALPSDFLTATDFGAWRALSARLPAVPMAKTDGQLRMVPAEKHEAVPRNTENAELYGVFPFKLYGVGRPNLEIGRWTFAQRMFPDTGGWRQDALQAALLGLTETATFFVAKNFNDGNTTPARFKGFWGPNYDWLPDFDHGSVTQLALQAMLVQAVDDKILLFPAWPVDRWNVTFKAHLPGQTIIEGELKDGELVSLTVLPESRRRDIVVLLNKDKNTASL
ncbi:MAG: hypothetical protein KA257_13220, partial [Opitutaceae bacterium]|nr:hypothetical protein [Opitutaceae bacterium]